MARLTLLLPAASRFAGVAMPPALAKALGRADRTQADAGEAAQLARYLTLLPQGWPAAALTRLLDAGEDDARRSAWLRADPAHVRPDINGARLLGVGVTVGIDQADVEALLPALRPLFGDAGFQLDAPHPARWYLRLAAGTPLPAFSSPHDALGDDVFDHTPRGDAARRWRAWPARSRTPARACPQRPAPSPQQSQACRRQPPRRPPALRRRPAHSRSRACSRDGRWPPCLDRGSRPGCPGSMDAVPRPSSSAARSRPARRAQSRRPDAGARAS